MGSWLRKLRRRTTSADDGAESTQDRPPGSDWPVVELLTATAAMAFELDPDGDRLTDLLNAHETLDIVAEDGAPGTIDVDEILVAFPPPHRAHPQRRLHRPRRPVRMRVGPYRVEGHLHVPPGADATGYLYRVGPRFAALTEAAIWTAEAEPIERRADVIIVNVAAAVQVEAIVPPAEVADAEGEPPPG